MNLALPSGPLTQAIGWALLHLVWQGAVVAAMLAVLLRAIPRRNASLRYGLSCAALLAVVALGIVGAVRSYHRADAPGEPATVTAPAANTLLVTTIQTSPAPAPRADRLRAWSRAAGEALPAVVAIWLAGVALFSLRLVVDGVRARRLVTRHAIRAREQWQALTRRLAIDLGVRQAVRVFESALVEVPSVIGLMRPALLLPASTLSGLSVAQIEMILAHELAHVRRHDFLVNLLQAVVETLLFYHPAVWWISRQVRIERENCCDDLAIALCGDPVQYARALLRLEELRAPAPRLALAANGGSLFARVHRLVAATPGSHDAFVRGAGALVILSCVLLVAAAPSFSRTDDGASRTPVVARVAAEALATRESGPIASVEPDAVGADAEAPAAADGTPAAADGDGSWDDAAADADAPDPAVDEPAELRRLNGIRDLDDLIALRALDVTPEYIRAMRRLFPQATLKQIAGMKAVGATAELVRDMRAVGIEVRTADQASGLAALGVTGDFVRAMRDAGIAVRSADQASGLRAVGVSPEFVREMRAIGLAVDDADQATGLRALGVSPEFVRSLRDAGLTVDSAEEAQGLRAVGVSADFVRALRDAGLAVDSAEEFQGLAAVGVTPDYVRQMRAAGVPISDADDVQSLRALGITPEFVRSLARAGYRNLSVETLTKLGAGGLTGDFVREMSKYRSR